MRRRRKQSAFTSTAPISRAPSPGTPLPYSSSTFPYRRCFREATPRCCGARRRTRTPGAPQAPRPSRLHSQAPQAGRTTRTRTRRRRLRRRRSRLALETQRASESVMRAAAVRQMRRRMLRALVRLIRPLLRRGRRRCCRSGAARRRRRLGAAEGVGRRRPLRGKGEGGGACLVTPHCCPFRPPSRCCTSMGTTEAEEAGTRCPPRRPRARAQQPPRAAATPPPPLRPHPQPQQQPPQAQTQTQQQPPAAARAARRGIRSEERRGGPEG